MIADAHNDLLLELVLRSDEPNPFARYWLPKLRAGGVALQVCAVYAANLPPAEASDAAWEQVRAFERAALENEDDVFVVRERADLDLAGRDGRIGLLLSLEGADPLGDDPAAFDALWDVGVRMVSLTWNTANAFAGGTDTPEQGLTRAGAELVRRLAAKGAIVDLAHASEATFFETLACAPEAAVLVSHACCRAVHDHRRNVTDEQLRALAERDGVLGLMTLALVVGGRSVERLVDHADHAVSVIGPSHVGLGADVIDQVTDAEIAAGLELQPALLEARVAGGGRLGLGDFTGPEHYPALVAALARRGYAGPDLDGILAENLLRLLRRTLP